MLKPAAETPATDPAEVEQVNRYVHHESDQAGQPAAPDLAHRFAAPDHRERALVEVLERLRGARLAVADRVPHVPRLLDRDRGETWERLAVGTVQRGRVADDGDLRVAREREVGVDLHPAAAVRSRAGRLRHKRGQPGGSHARRPDHRAGGDPLGFVAELDRHPARVDPGDHRVLSDRDAETAQLVRGLGGGRLGERRHHAFARIEQDHAGRIGMDAPELALHRMAREDRELPRDLDARRTTAHDDEREPLVASVRVLSAFSLLKGSEDAVAEVQGVIHCLQAATELLPFVVPEVRRLASRGDDQAVVVDPLPAVEHDLASVYVDVGDLRHQRRRICISLEHVPKRRRDVAGGKRTGGDLVDQRLEQQMVVAVDQGHVDVGLLQALGRLHPSKPAADDHDPAAAGARAVSRHWPAPVAAAPTRDARAGGRRPAARSPSR